MNEFAAPDGQPSYRGGYEEISFAQLRRLIHDAVERLSDPSFSAKDELPRSQEELYALCKVLKAKADALKDDTPLPKRPAYDGPPDPGYFTPSDELAPLYDELERAEDRVAYQIERGSGGVYLEYIQDELKKVKQKIAPIERREKEEYQKRLRAYREAHDPHRLRLRSWRAEVDEVKRRREAEAKRDELVRRTHRKVKNAFDPKRVSGPRPTGTYQWEILPPGEKATDEHVRRYYDKVLRQGGLDGFSQERLDKMLALPYEDWFEGKAGFYGYSIFTFVHTEKVLLECPVYANASYVLNSGKKRLLEMNKQELMASSEAKRIFHVGDNWYQRLKQELEIGMSAEQVGEGG